jgi:hypothetical protein
MSPKELLLNACKHQMNINITDVKVSLPEESIQYYYKSGNINYFLRISKDRLINGITDEVDGKAYASGLYIDVIKYLIDNFSRVNLYEMAA